MKLYTSRGQVQIPYDLSFEIKKTNPFFSDEGEQSIPVTLPASQENLRLLGHPQRLAGDASGLRKTGARLEAGILHLSGQLLVDTVSGSGISAALALAESDMYAKNKDRKLPELFRNITHTCPSGQATPTTVSGWAAYLSDIYLGLKTDIFTCCTAYVEYQKDDNIAIVLNEPDYQQGTEDNEGAALRWACRKMVISSSKNEAVPDGYGLTPFLYLHSFLDLLLSTLGYAVTANAFATSTNNMNRLILLNSNADTICKGRICYGDIVPGCTVGEFVTWMEDKFHVTVMIDSTRNTAAVVSMESVLSSAVTDDLSHIVDGKPSVAVSDARHVTLKSDTGSIDGAAPAEETLDEFFAKYPVTKELTESQYRSDATRQRYTVVFRRATGMWELNTRNLETDTIDTTVLGSGMFTYSRAEDGDTDSHEAKDVVPAMIVRRIPSTGTANDEVCAPYIGERRHSNTGYDSGDSRDDNRQDIIVAFDAGASRTDQYHVRSYRLATTQRHDNTGQQWNTWSLTPEDIYTLFWSTYNTVILNNNLTVSMKADIPLERLANFDMNAIRLYRGVRLLCTELNYTISRNGALCGESRFLVLTNAGRTPTPAPTLTEQIYQWGLSYPQLDYEIQRLRVEHNLPEADWQANVTWGALPTSMTIYQYLRPPLSSGETIKTFSRTATVDFISRTGGSGHYQYPITTQARYGAEPIANSVSVPSPTDSN